MGKGGYAASVASSNKSGDVSSIGGGSERGSGGKVGSSGSTNDEGLGAISRRGLVDWIFEGVSSVPKLAFINESWKIQLAILAYQYVVWWTYAVHPIWGWDMDYSSTVVKWLQGSTLHGWVLIARDINKPKFMTGFLFGGLSLTLLLYALTLHMWWLERTQRSVRKIEQVAARIIQTVVFKVFGVAIMGIYLLPASCNRSLDFPGYAEGTLLLFPGKECAKLSLEAGFGAIAFVLHAPLYILFSVMDCELDVMTRVPFATASPPAMWRIATLEVLSVLTFHVLVGESKKWAALILVFLWTWIVYIHCVRVPYLGAVHARMRSAIAGALCFAFCCVAALTDGRSSVEMVLAAGSLPAAALAFWLTSLRQSRARRLLDKFWALREAVASGNGRKLHKFDDHEALEVSVRIARPPGFRPKKPAEPLVGGLDAAIRHAQATTGDSAKLQNVQALLQAFLQEDTHTAHSTVQKARGFKCAWVDRLVTLRLEAELRERQTDTEGDLLDLSSYVEMQTHMKAMVKFHRQVVEANRDVWKMVIRHDVGMDDLIWVIHRWRAYEQRAEVQYRTMLERYPRNVRLLRAYAFFLQSVQCDVTGAHQYFQEADKLEDAAAMNAEAEAELDRTRMTQVDDTRDAVVVISPEGVIMLTNTNLNRMFGYKKGQLLGRNVSSLMPPPFSVQHNSYLKNYLTTGVAKVLNQVRHVIALHKDKFVFPVALGVTKISRGGKDAFMGIIRAAPDTERIGKAWVTSAGMVVACNKGFANLVGYDYNDIAGKHINTVLDHDRVTQLISTAVAGQEGEEFQAEIPARSVFGEEFLCNISTALGGTVTMRVVLLAFDRLSEEVPIVLAEPGTGKVLRANRAMERFSGYKRREIETLKLADLLPEPFATLHTHQYLGEGMGTHPAPVAPCVHGRVAEIVTKNGTVAPMAAEARRIKQPDADAHMQTEMEGDSMVVMLRLRPLSSHAARGSSSMTLKVDRRGTIAHAEPSGAFPASGEALVGRGLGDVVQVGGDVGSLVEELRRAKPATKTARCTVIGEGGRGHAASMDAAIDPSDKERVVVTLHRLDMHRLVLEVDASLTITQCRGSSTPLLAVPEDRLAGTPLSRLFPAFEGQTSSDFLLTGGQTGGGVLKKAQLVGPRREETLRCVDGAEMRAVVQAADRRGGGGRIWVVVMPVPEPFPPMEALEVDEAMEGSAGGVGVEEGEERGEGEGGEESRAGSDGAGAEGEEAEAESGVGGERGEGRAEGRAGALGGKLAGADVQSSRVGSKGLGGSRHGGLEGSIFGAGGEAKGSSGAQRRSRFDSQAVRFKEGEEGGRGEGDGEGEAEEGEDEEPVNKASFAFKRMEKWVDNMGELGACELFDGVAMGEVVELNAGNLKKLHEAWGGEDKGKKGIVVDLRKSEKRSRMLSRGLDEIAAVDSDHKSNAAMARKSERSRGADGADGGGDGAGAMADDGRPPRTTKKGEGDPDSGETTPMPDDGPAHKLSKAPSRARSHQSHRSHKSHRSVVAAMTAADMAAAANQIGGFHAVAVGADPAKGDEEDAALAVQSGAAIEMENFALDAIEEETEDAAHLMDQETAADKARKFKRVHASLTAETFWRPFRALRLAIRGVIAIVLVVHGLCFGLLMAWTSEQKSLTKLLLRSGDVVHEVLLVKVYARLLQMHGAGSHVGPRAEEEIRFELAHAAQVFMEEFTEISSASGGMAPAYRDKVESLYRDVDLTVTVPVQTVGGPTEERQMSYWDLGNAFAAAGMGVAEAQGDKLGELADHYDLRFLELNGEAVLKQRALEVEDAVQGSAKANLRTIGVIAIVFLLIETCVVLPIAFLILRHRVASVHHVRCTLLGVLVAIPRPVATEFARRKVLLTELDEEDAASEDGDGEAAAVSAQVAAQQQQQQQQQQQGGAGGGGGGASKGGAAKGAPPKEQRGVKKRIRQLMSSRIPFDELVEARYHLRSQKRKLSKLRRFTAIAVLPLAMWALVSAIVNGVTWQLQESAAAHLEPKRAASIAASAATGTVYWAAETVFRWLESGSEDDLAACRASLGGYVDELMEAQNALMFGTEDLDGESVEKGTLWRNRELLDIHFGEPCFATRVPCDDPSKLEDRGSTQRGLYALILRAVEEARLLIQDDPADLVLASTRLAFLLSAGLEELEEGMGRSVDALSRDNVSVDAIQVAHILMLVATVVVLALMDVLVVVPALSGHATEMRVLSCMVSDLPKDMGVEELLAECKEEAERKREGGDDVGVLDGGGEELLLREVEGEEEGEKKKGKKGKGKDQKDAGEKGDATGTRKAGT